jgi:hypothetical protein
MAQKQILCLVCFKEGTEENPVTARRQIEMLTLAESSTRNMCDECYQNDPDESPSDNAFDGRVREAARTQSS